MNETLVKILYKNLPSFLPKYCKIAKKCAICHMQILPANQIKKISQFGGKVAHLATQPVTVL